MNIFSKDQRGSNLRHPRKQFSQSCRGLIALALSICSASSLVAQTWGPESYALAPGSALGVTCDSAGSIYVCGQFRLGFGNHRAVVLKNDNRGASANWSTVFTSSEASKMLWFQAITSRSDGVNPDELFALGDTKVTVTRPTSGNLGWVHGWEVLRRTDDGLTWESILGPYDSGFYAQSPKGIAVDDNGNVYVVGNFTEAVQSRKGTTLIYHGAMLKGVRGLDGNGNVIYGWESIASIPSNTGANSVICIGSEVFVAASDGSGARVFKSANGGTTWTSIDQLSGGFAVAITADQAGNLIWAGSAPQKSGTAWIVRKGTRYGTFQTIDSIQGPLKSGAARSVTVDFAGNVHVTGNLGASPQWWITRQGKETNGVWSWTTTDNNLGTAESRSLAADFEGNVYAVGLTDNTDFSEWMFRRKLVGMTP